jgi:hypothetical protein
LSDFLDGLVRRAVGTKVPKVAARPAQPGEAGHADFEPAEFVTNAEPGLDVQRRDPAVYGPKTIQNFQPASQPRFHAAEPPIRDSGESRRAAGNPLIPVAPIAAQSILNSERRNHDPDRTAPVPAVSSRSVMVERHLTTETRDRALPVVEVTPQIQHAPMQSLTPGNEAPIPSIPQAGVRPVEVHIGTIEVEVAPPARPTVPTPPRPRSAAPYAFDRYNDIRRYRRRG